MNSMERLGRLEMLDKKSILFWSNMLVLMLFMVITPFSRGLFNGSSFSFDSPIQTTTLLGCFYTMFLAFSLFVRERNWKIAQEWVGLLGLFFPFCYLIAAIPSVFLYGAWNSVYIHFMASVFFLVGIHFARSRLGAKMILYTIMGSGYILTIYGFMNWFGNASFPDSFLQGNRLSNVFQYPNTYAAYLLVLFIATLTMLQTTSKKLGSAFYGGMLVLLMISFFLTMSRGAMLVLPPLFLAYLCFLPMRKQLEAILYAVISIGVSLVLFSSLLSTRESLNQAFSSSLSGLGWLMTVGASIIVGGAILFIRQRYFLVAATVRRRDVSRWVIPGVMFIGIIVISLLVILKSPVLNVLPDGIADRLLSINSQETSIATRGVVYKDALTLLENTDSLWFGAGGGSWGVLYEKYKSYPYTSRQAHNLFIQYGVEVGLVGLAVFLAIVIVCIYYFFRGMNSEGFELRRLAFLFIPIGLMIHALADFDLSFAYIEFILFLCLGAMASMASSYSKGTQKGRTKGAYIFPLALFLMALVLAVRVIPQVQANGVYRNLVTNISQMDIQTINEKTSYLAAQDPVVPTFVRLRTDILSQIYAQSSDRELLAEAADLLEDATLRLPMNKLIIEAQIINYQMLNEKEMALDIAVQSLEHLPWEITLYDKIITLLFDLGSSQDDANRDIQWDRAIEYYNLFLQKSESLERLTIGQQYESRQFSTTKGMALSMGQIYFYREKYDKAAEILSTVRSNDMTDPINRTVGRWLLASLWAQNKNDSTLYDMLLAADPEEEQLVRSIFAVASK